MNPSLKSKSFWKVEQLKAEITNLSKKQFFIPFIGISETWLKPFISDQQIHIDNFNIFRADRTLSKNGGVLLYIEKTIIIDSYDSFDDNTCNGIICLSKNKKCIIACIYRPPNASKDSFANLLKFLTNFLEEHNTSHQFQIFITGDFNFPNICWNNLADQSSNTSILHVDLFNFMDKYFLVQYVNNYTRKNNILDLFLSDDPCFVELMQVEDIFISDHYLLKIFTSYFNNLSTDFDTPINKGLCDSDIDIDFSKINLNSSNFNNINLDFSNINWDLIVKQKIDDFPNLFRGVVYSVLTKHSELFNLNPKKKRLNKYQRDRKIMDRKIRRYRKKIPSCSNKTKLDSINRKITVLIENKKMSLFNERFTKEKQATNAIKTDVKYFFKYANRHKKVSASPSILVDADNNTITDKHVIANLLQDQFRSVFSSPRSCKEYQKYFPNNLLIHNPLPPDLQITNEDIITAINEMKSSSASPKHDVPARVFKECKNTLCTPLRLFWEKSFESGHIPESYKKQQIIPLHKKGSTSKAEHWRPIVLNPHEIKLFERVLRKKLVKYFEENALLNHNQHGFRRMRSCATQLLTHTHNILTNAIEGADTDSIYIDYSKAFDKVDHDILLWKLRQYKIPDKYVTWIENFLKGRIQVVYNNGVYSYSTVVKSGVPQGSVLGPLLFIIFINDLPNIIKNCNILTFADDTKIISKVRDENDIKNLQENLNKIIKYSTDNNMILNDNKFELVSHDLNARNTRKIFFEALPFHNHNTSYTASNSEILPSPFVRDLGVLIDSKLSWANHLHHISVKAKQICGWILSVFCSRDKHIMLTLFNSLVRSKLEYCCIVWSPHLIKDIVKVEQVQRYFTYKIKHMKDLNYWDRLKVLGILSLQRRRELNIILHLWKIKHCLYPNSIDIRFKVHLRTQAVKAIISPLPKVKGRVLTIHEESFAIRAAKLWNILPSKITHIATFFTFKTALIDYLKTIPDQPPLPGYPYRTNNSLIEQSLYSMTHT